METGAPERRVPVVYGCANRECGRRLVVASHLADRPAGFPADRVHLVADTTVLPFTMQCSCGHYTVVSSWWE